MRRIGITTTVPSEVIWAAGAVPVDLNNIFITSSERERFIRIAELGGYPRNICSWIKGIYGVLRDDPSIQTVVAVTQGDCSNTHALMETLQLRGIETIPFAYPYGREPETLQYEIEKLAERFGTDVKSAEDKIREFENIRINLDLLDKMTWNDDLISGSENHLWLVSSSDFNGDPERFSDELSKLLAEAESRKPFTEKVRLGFMGVPPIIDDIYETAENLGGRVVFNEIQRQFSMPERGSGIVEQYLAYTYPYDIFHRLNFIYREIEKRKIRGMIHYVQSFCHRHIEDLIVREKLTIPVLTIEGESPGKMDERTKIRLQAFIEMLQ